MTLPPQRILAELNLYDRSIAFLLVCFLASCYMLTYSGVIQSSDGLAMFSSGESIVRQGQVDANQLLWMGQQQGSFGPDGNLYSRKGLGMTLLALPLIWLAKQWSNIGLVQAALLLNPILTAWTGGLIYRATVRLGWSRFVAVTTALAYGLATLAWPYAQTFFSDPMAAWGLFGGLYGILAYGQSRRKRYLLLGGTAWGLAYLSRAVNLVTLPIYVLTLAVLFMPKREEFSSAWNAGLVKMTVGHLREWIFFGLPILVSGFLSLWWNWLRYGHVLETGYLASESFNGDWLSGIYGLTVGPARGLLWYSPVVLLALLGWRWFWRRARWLLIAALGVPLLYLLLYAKWYMWHGGYSWGPRFLVPVLPFIMWLTAPVWHEIVEGRRRFVDRLSAILLLLLSLAVQWLGLSIPFSHVQDWLAQNVEPLFATETFVRLSYSPLLLQWRFVDPGNLHFAWWLAGANRPDWIAFLLLTGTVAVGGWLLIRQVRVAEVAGVSTPYWIFGVALVLVVLVVLMRYQEPLSGSGNIMLAREIRSHEEPGDGIVHLRPQESQQIANAYHGNLPTYGLLPTDSLDDAQAAWLEELDRRYRRLWLVPAAGLPDGSGWERALRSSVFLLSDERVGLERQRLVLYAFPDTQPLTETGIGVYFGDPEWVRLNGYGLTRRTEPGGELLLALEWESLIPVPEQYRVFVHLLNQADEKVAQRDGQPVLWSRPTDTWQPGERIIDRYGLLLPPDLPPGLYRVSVGLYHPDTGERQPVSVGPEAAVSLGPVRVEVR